MASLGHFAVAAIATPLAAPRTMPRRALVPLFALFAGASMLPDADVIAFALRIPYEHAFGHRGASHSLAFALIAGFVAALAARSFGLPRTRAFVAFTLIIATHPLLDMLTDGGLGIAVFYPFTAERYFFPWRPIPVSPIGAGLISPYGFRVLATELVYFSPLFIAGALLARRHSLANVDHLGVHQ